MRRRPRLFSIGWIPLAGAAALASCASAPPRGVESVSSESAAESAAAEEKDPFRKTFRTKDEAVEAMREKAPSAPRSGDVAPDFTLSSPDGARTVTLSSFRGVKPVVLVFGSYT